MRPLAAGRTELSAAAEPATVALEGAETSAMAIA